MQNRGTLTGLLALLFSLWAGADSLSCGSFYKPVKPVLSYGLEIEYTIERHPTLLQDYRGYHTSEKKWRSFDASKRLDMAQNQDTKHRVNTLVKMATAPDWVPETMDREGHGTFEANAMIFDSVEALKKALNLMEARYGRGSAQVHVVFNRKEVTQPLSGFVSFSADRAQLRNLTLGYQKYLADNSRIPATSLLHYVLGPMSAIGEAGTIKLEKNIRTEAKLRNEVVGKYFLSTVLRAGIYGHTDLIGYELRQHNFDYEGLKRETDLVTTVIMQNKLAQYNRFVGQIPLEDVILARIESIYGSQALAWKEKLSRIEPDKTNLVLNMQFFLRDWSQHPIIETLHSSQKQAMRTKLIDLQAQLLTDLNTLMDSNLTKREKLNHLRILLAKWAYDTGLLDAFDAFEQTVVPDFYSKATSQLDKAS